MFVTTASEGRQGVHRFFTTSIRWGELEHILVFPDDIEAEIDDDKRMQRGLAKARLRDLVRYLTEAPDHFFSALTLIMLPRDITRAAIEADDENPEWDYRFEPIADGVVAGQQRLGNLWLSGDVRLFTADGQHRAKSAMQAVREKAALAKEEVPVVLIPFQDADRVRQLFSDLNLNAKPVSKTMGYDFETRDPVALIAKRVASSVPLFSGRVNRISNSLPRTSANVITLNTVVQGTRDILAGLISAGRIDEPVKSSDPIAGQVVEVWEGIVGAFADRWASIVDGTEGAAGALREEYLFPHGLGWLGLARAAGYLIENHDTDWQERFAKAVARFDWRRRADEWQGNAVLYDEERDVYRVNNTGSAVEQLARKVAAAAE